ncbi:MAG: GNAT family N-acetyltransferase [Clostridiales bacterium]
MNRIEDIKNHYRTFVNDFISKTWGSQIIVSRGKVFNANRLEGYVVVDDEDEVKGILTYCTARHKCEIVSLNSLLENEGIGSSLIEHLEKYAKSKKCKKITVFITNDNMHAFGFYQKKGYNMKALHRNSVIDSRKIKPQIPLIGYNDIAVLHEVEFEKALK